MIRVCEFKMDGLAQVLKFASMTTAEAEKHVNEGKEMLARHSKSPLPPEEWKLRARKTVCDAMNRLDSNSAWTPEKLDEEFDIPTIDALFMRILEASGLRSGEVQAAASPSPKSAAA